MKQMYLYEAHIMPKLRVPCEFQWSSRKLMHMYNFFVKPQYDYLINICINLNKLN